MRVFIGLICAIFVVAALMYSFQQLVLKPASALSGHHAAALERMPSHPQAGVPAVPPGSTSPAAPPAALATPIAPVPETPLLPVPVPPRLTTGELIAVLEHGTDEQAAAAIRELVAIGEPALAPLTEFQTRWRKTLATLQTAEVEVAATGDDVDLSGSIRKASQLSSRSATAIRAITRQRAESAIKSLQVDAPVPPIPAAAQW